MPYWSAYAASKAALDMLVGIYAAEVAHTQVRVNLYNPGPMRTGMRREAFPGEDQATLPPPEAHAEGLIRLALPRARWHRADEPRADGLRQSTNALPAAGQKLTADQDVTLSAALPGSRRDSSGLRMVMRIGTPGRSKSSRRPVDQDSADSRRAARRAG